MRRLNFSYMAGVLRTARSPSLTLVPEPRRVLGFDIGLSRLERRCSPYLRSAKRVGTQPAEPAPQLVHDFWLLGALLPALFAQGLNRAP